MVFQPQSNKKKKERGKGKRRKKEGKERGERRRKEGKENDKIFISLFLKEIPIPAYPNQQVFPPGYPDDGELPSLRPNGENAVAAVRTSMRRRVGTFLDIVGKLLPSFVALA